MIGHSSLSFGVDLGGTSTRIGLYDANMRLLSSLAMPTRVSAGPEACVHDMAAAVHTLAAGQKEHHEAQQICGLGIGSPGPINLMTGVLGLLPNFPGWDNFPLRDALAEATGLPITLESDANAAAIAEWKYGAGKSADLDSMAMITLGTGVGSGLILNGKVWHGRYGMGGEVGHSPIDAEGELCGCGSRGCLEMYTSASGLRRLTERVADSADPSSALGELVANPSKFDPVQLALLAPHDPSASEVFRLFGYYLGLGVAGLLNTLDLPLVVIGGGVAGSWSLFAPSMFRTIHDFSVIYRLGSPLQRETFEQDRIFICPASLGPSAGLLGAALLPRLAVVSNV